MTSFTWVIHMTIADWNFEDTTSSTITQAYSDSQADLSAKLAGDPNAAGPDDGVLFKSKIDGLSTDVVDNLTVASADDPTQYYTDDFASSDTTVESADYGMLYTPENAGDPPLSTSDQEKLKQGQQWNVLDATKDVIAKLVTAGGDILTRVLTQRQNLIFVDNNRDGIIETDGKDRTSTSKPFLFWLNTNRDVWGGGDYQAAESAKPIGGPGDLDSQSTAIGSMYNADGTLNNDPLGLKEVAESRFRGFCTSRFALVERHGP